MKVFRRWDVSYEDLVLEIFLLIVGEYENIEDVEELNRISPMIKEKYLKFLRKYDDEIIKKVFHFQFILPESSEKINIVEKFIDLILDWADLKVLMWFVDRLWEDYDWVKWNEVFKLFKIKEEGENIINWFNDIIKKGLKLSWRKEKQFLLSWWIKEEIKKILDDNLKNIQPSLFWWNNIGVSTWWVIIWHQIWQNILFNIWWDELLTLWMYPVIWGKLLTHIWWKKVTNCSQIKEINWELTWVISIEGWHRVTFLWNKFDYENSNKKIFTIFPQDLQTFAEYLYKWWEFLEEQETLISPENLSWQLNLSELIWGASQGCIILKNDYYH